MIIGIGIDNIKTQSIEEIAKKYGKRFLDRIYTPAEQARCGRNGSYQDYAGYWAAKEAVMKALETGSIYITPTGISFLDIEVYHESGAPRIRLYGKARNVAEKKGINKIDVSLTTLDSICSAYVIAED